MPNDFAMWLDSTMRQRRLSQADLARAVGVADAQVSRWRRGQVVPSVRYLQQIADVIGVPRMTLDKLAGLPVSPPPDEAPDAVREAEIEQLQTQFARLLREKVPQPLWGAYAEACAALAEGLGSSLGPAYGQEPDETHPDRGMGFRR